VGGRQNPKSIKVQNSVIIIRPFFLLLQEDRYTDCQEGKEAYVYIDITQFPDDCNLTTAYKKKLFFNWASEAHAGGIKIVFTFGILSMWEIR
jgi:hypothetical protein